jgi:hypothetical protein
MSRPRTPTQRELEHFLATVPRGGDNAITATELCYRLGFVPRHRVPNDNDKRKVRNLRQASRETDTVVLGDDRGYFIPLDHEDAESALARRASQATTMLQDIEQDRTAIRRMFDARRMAAARSAAHPLQQGNLL